jgi:hypothetical protein
MLSLMAHKVVEVQDNIDLNCLPFFHTSSGSHLVDWWVLAIRRREGYEFMIGPPQVINREVKGKKHEPYEVNRNFISVNTLCLSIMSLMR